MQEQTNGAGPGAVYVQTNAAPNEVIAHRRASDGSLEPIGSVATGGDGDRLTAPWLEDARQAFRLSLRDGHAADAVEIAIGASFLWRNAMGCAEGDAWIADLLGHELSPHDQLWVHILRTDVGQGRGDHRQMFDAAAAAAGLMDDTDDPALHDRRRQLEALDADIVEVVDDDPGWALARIAEAEGAHLVVQRGTVEGQPVLDVLDPAAADDARRLLLVGLPERRLVDPVRLLDHSFAEAEGLEHLHRAARDAVGLTEQQTAGLLLDDPRRDRWERRQLRGQRQTSGTTADDQDIHLVGQAIGTVPDADPPRVVDRGLLARRC